MVPLNVFYCYVLLTRSRLTHMQPMWHTTFNLTLSWLQKPFKFKRLLCNSPCYCTDALGRPHFFQDIHGKESHSGNNNVANGTQPLTLLSSLGRSQPFLQVNHSSKATFRELAIHFLVGMLLRVSGFTMSKPWQGEHRLDMNVLFFWFFTKRVMSEPQRIGSLIGRSGKKLSHARS